MSITITITVKDGFIDELKTGFLKSVKRPSEYVGLSDIDFFKKWLEDNIKMAYSKGKTQIAYEDTEVYVEPDIVTVS